MNDKPLVSIVLTSYNQKPKLDRALTSLLDQTYQNIEIIIVDDCSTDGESIPFIKEAEAKHERVRSFIQPANVGIPKNKNTGFKMATGEYITYLDGDDYYYRHKLEQELQLILDNPSFDVVYSNFEYRTDDDQFLLFWNERGDNLPEGSILEHVITRSFPRNALFRFELMKKNVLESINYYDESITAFHDWDSRIRYSKLFCVGYNDSVCAAYLQDPAGISKRKSRTYLIDEMIRVFNKNAELLEGTNCDMSKIVNHMQASLYMKKLNSIDSARYFTFKAFRYLLKYPKNHSYVVSTFRNRVKTSALAKKLSS